LFLVPDITEDISMVATITPMTLADLRRKGEKVMLIDVRTPAEFGEVHVDFARNVPLDRIDPEEIQALAGSDPVYVVCKSGNRSQKACEKLVAAGLKDVISIEGGTTACEAAGVPVVRGRKAMSLERQVRVAAGAMVAIGAALAAFGPDLLWQRIGAGLAGFVGCGLVFAGITDTCGMAMLIAKMPWNQTCRSAKSCCSHAAIFWLVLGGLVLGGLCGTALAEHTRDSLDAVRQAVAEQKAVMIDVREPEEWQEGHLTGAGLLPLSVLEKGIDPQKLASVLPKDKIIYCYCLAGGRCAEAASLLKPLGYDVRALKPGYPQLVNAGFPAMVGK
jgi:rhodanese-related sulfurtransferase